MDEITGLVELRPARRLAVITACVAAALVFIYSWGLARDNYYESNNYNYNHDTLAGSFLHFVLLLSVVYVVRLVILFAPSLLGATWGTQKRVFVGAVIGLAIPELLLLYAGISMWRSDSAICTGTETSPCGWGMFAVGAYVTLAGALQIVGEVVGGVSATLGKKARNRI